MLALPFEDGGISYWWKDGPLALQSINHASKNALDISVTALVAECPGVELDPCAFPLGDGRWTETVGQQEMHAAGFHVEGGLLRLAGAIRQWVEEPPSLSVARLLEATEGWKRLQTRLAAPARRFADVEWTREYGVAREYIIQNARWYLAAYGLPPTRATAIHLLQTLFPDSVPGERLGASRGVMVTTILLVPTAESGLRDSEVVSQIAGSSPWSTDAVRRRASKVVEEHTRWWERLPLPKVAEVNLRRLNGRPADELAEWVALHIDGRLPLDELQKRALAQERDAYGKELHPLEKKQVLRRLAERIRYQQRMATFLSGKRARRLSRPD